MTEIEQLKRHATEMANANNAGMQGMSKREAMEREPTRRAALQVFAKSWIRE